MIKRLAAPNLQLPWSSSDEDNSKLKFWFLCLFVPFMIVSIIVTVIDVPEKDREELERVPPELAQVILEKQPIPEPPKPKPKPKPKEEPKKKDKPKPKPEPKPKPKPKPEPIPETVKIVEAKEAAIDEINQVKDDLADLRNDFAELNDIASNDLSLGVGETEKVDRSLIGANATSKSQNVSTSNYSSNTGTTAVSGKKTTRVNSTLGASKGKSNKKDIVKQVVQDKSRRSEEEIRATIDANRSAIDAVYNRALRTNPQLEGKVVFKIVIEPNGRVSQAEIISSELNDPKLERRLLSKMKAINFGAKNVLTTPVNYAIDFLPF